VPPGSVAIEDCAAGYCAYASDSAEYYSNEPYLKVPVPQPDSKPGEFFQLDPDDAVVLIGLTPALVKYFSYTPKITCFDPHPRLVLNPYFGVRKAQTHGCRLEKKLSLIIQNFPIIR